MRKVYITLCYMLFIAFSASSQTLFKNWIMIEPIGYPLEAEFHEKDYSRVGAHEKYKLRYKKKKNQLVIKECLTLFHTDKYYFLVEELTETSLKLKPIRQNQFFMELPDTTLVFKNN